MPAPGKPTPAAPHLHINNVNACRGRLQQSLNRFDGVTTKSLHMSVGDALSKPRERFEPQLDRKGAIGNGPYSTDNAIEPTSFWSNSEEPDRWR